MNFDYYAKVPTAVTNEPRLYPEEKAILIYLLSFRRAAYPSVTAIVNATGMAPKTVRKYLNSLRAANVMTWRRGNSTRPNEYSLCPVDAWRLDTPERTRRVGLDEAQDALQTPD